MRRVKQGKDARNKSRPYLVRWTDGVGLNDGKVKWFQESFRYKLEADRFAAQKRLEPPDTKDLDPEEMRLGRFLKEWSKTRAGGDYRAGTRQLDANTVSRLVSHFGKDAPLSEITPMEAANFIASLSRIDKREGPLSAWSRARTLRNVRTIFNAAVEWDLITGNPFSGIKRPKAPECKWYWLPPDELYALLNASNGVRTVSLRRKVIYVLIYCCGLRLGEVLSLTWEDSIDIIETWMDGVASITGNVRIANRKATVDRPPFYVKDKESREIRIPQRCLELLVDLRDYNAMTDQSPYVALDRGQYETAMAKWQQYRRAGREWQNHDMANNMLTVFKRHAKWAQIRPQGSLSLHVLRKCCITNWANNINNPEVVRKLAGHADIKTTMMYYSQVTEDQRRKAAEATDRLLEMGLAASTGTYEG